MTNPTVRQLVTRFEQFAPKALAEPHDPVGLQLGTLTAPVHKVLVTLDVRPEVVQEAIQVGADLIFAHHPMMFHPAKNLDLSDPQNQMYAELIKHDITVYAAHTNLDSADGGMNDWLAAALGLTHTTGLVPGQVDDAYLVSVHVPPMYAAAVRLALTQVGAGTTDHYTGASYVSGGHSYYTPKIGASPYLGTSGEQHDLEATSIAVKIQASQLPLVLQTIQEVHPFEEPAYTVTPLVGAGHQYMMGRVGDLVTPMSVTAFAEHCRDVFHLRGLRVISHHPEATVKRVAVLGGDGGKFFHLAQRAGADAYVTGDVYYHTGHDMLAAGLTVIDPGHHIESICKPELTRLLKQWSAENNWSLTVVASQLNTDPFTFIA